MFIVVLGTAVEQLFSSHFLLNILIRARGIKEAIFLSFLSAFYVRKRENNLKELNLFTFGFC